MNKNDPVNEGEDFEQVNISTTLPSEFFPGIQENHGDSLTLTVLGSELLERNTEFFKNLHFLIQKMEEEIIAAVALQQETNKVFTKTLMQNPPITVPENSERAFTLKFLGRGSESWAFLLTIGEEKYVLRMPTRPLRPKMNGPLEELENTKELPQYRRQLEVVQAIKVKFKEALENINMHLPDYIMASNFFSLTKFVEKTEEIDSRIFKRDIAPIGRQIYLEISELAEVYDDEFWKGVIIDWALNSNSIWEREDGGYVCIDPIIII